MASDAVKAIVAEWVLTSGSLPGFEDRLKATLPEWNVVGAEGKSVYRGQGGGVVPVAAGAPPPETLKTGFRPVVATSKTPEAITRYAGADCCLFEIQLQAGIRYLDVNAVLVGAANELTIDDAAIRGILDMCPEMDGFPLKKTPLPVAKKVIAGRCMGRTGPRIGTIPSEDEIMVDGKQGTFSDPVPIAKLAGKTAFRVTYAAAVVGGKRRGRTFRRKDRTSNKNGRRLARKSKRHVRNRHA